MYVARPAPTSEKDARNCGGDAVLCCILLHLDSRHSIARDRAMNPLTPRLTLPHHASPMQYVCTKSIVHRSLCRENKKTSFELLATCSETKIHGPSGLDAYICRLRSFVRGVNTRAYKYVHAHPCSLALCIATQFLPASIVVVGRAEVQKTRAKREARSEFYPDLLQTRDSRLRKPSFSPLERTAVSSMIAAGPSAAGGQCWQSIGAAAVRGCQARVPSGLQRDEMQQVPAPSVDRMATFLFCFSCLGFSLASLRLLWAAVGRRESQRACRGCTDRPNQRREETARVAGSGTWQAGRKTESNRAGIWYV